MVTAYSTRASLAAAPISDGAGILTETNREGTFAWDGADLSTKVINDPEQGVYVPPISDPTGASGAWVRNLNGLSLTPFMFGAVGDGVTDDHVALQATFDFYAQATADLSVDFTGRFATSAGLFLGPDAGVSYRNNYHGCFYLVATAPIDRLLTLRNTRYLVWTGRLNLNGTGGASYSTRGCNVGVYNLNCSRAIFTGGMFLSEFAYAGLLSEDGTSSCQYGHIRAFNCGSGNTATGTSLTGSWSTPSNSGSASSTTQRTTITLAGAGMQIPHWVQAYAPINSFYVAVRINGRLYYVTGIKRADANDPSEKVTVTPWIEPGLISGTLTWSYGAAVVNKGNDSNINTYDHIDAGDCGAAYLDGALYGSNVAVLVAQSCGSGYIFGSKQFSSFIGGAIKAYYPENNSEDIIQVYTPGGSAWNHIHGTHELNLTKCYVLTSPRDSSGKLIGNHATFSRTSLEYRGRIYEHEKDGNNFHYGDSTFNYAVGPNKTLVEANLNSATVSLSAPNADLNRLFGHESGQLCIIGTGANGAPSGTISFVAPSGWTVNGGSSAAFSGFDGPALFVIYARFSSTNLIVRPVGKTLVDSKTHDAGSIAAGAAAYVDVPVTGAAPGDGASVSISPDLGDDIVVTARVTTANFVRVRLKNDSGAAVDPPSAIYTARVTKL